MSHRRHGISDINICADRAEEQRVDLVAELERAQQQLHRAQKRIRQLRRELHDAKSARIET